MRTFRQKVEPQGGELTRYQIWLDRERTDLLGAVAHYHVAVCKKPFVCRCLWKAITPGPGSMEEDIHLTMRSAIDALLMVQRLKES